MKSLKVLGHNNNSVKACVDMIISPHGDVELSKLD